MTSLHEPQEIWELYVSSWKAPTAVEKLALFGNCLSPDCVYRDPLTLATGYEALLEYMLNFHCQLPGGHFVTTAFWSHHDRSIARWNMVDGAGNVQGDGASYGEYDRGRGVLTAMTGFFNVPSV